MRGNGKVKLFVYGSLKRGYWNNRLLRKCRYLGTGVTKEPFKLYSVGFPYAVPDSRGLPVKGEVYEVDLKTLKDLDNLEGCPNHYKRKLVEVELASKQTVEAYIYYVDTPRGEPVPPKEGFFVWEGR
ncbi:gamma-glutamylcyclotransferase [Thermovibrio ammonificans]